MTLINFHFFSPIEIGIEDCSDTIEESIEYCNTTEESTEYCNTEESTMELDDVSDSETFTSHAIESREGGTEGSGDHTLETREGGAEGPGDHTFEITEGRVEGPGDQTLEFTEVPGLSIWETLRSIIKSTNHPNV